MWLEVGSRWLGFWLWDWYFVPGQWSSLCFLVPCPGLLFSATPFGYDVLPHLGLRTMELAIYGLRSLKPWANKHFLLYIVLSGSSGHSNAKLTKALRNEISCLSYWWILKRIIIHTLGKFREMKQHIADRHIMPSQTDSRREDILNKSLSILAPTAGYKFPWCLGSPCNLSD